MAADVRLVATDHVVACSCSPSVEPHAALAASSPEYDDVARSRRSGGSRRVTVLFAWRSGVWTYSTADRTKVLARERPQPSVEEFIAELPAFEFEWP